MSSERGDQAVPAEGQFRYRGVLPERDRRAGPEPRRRHHPAGERGQWTASDAHGRALRDIFGPTGWICTTSAATAGITGYGFLRLPGAACGSGSHS
ncbi:hypothetical protein [Kitasatospora sp. NPDC057223]|uniref:hypothetical protein n=1 Tax=Kitasatospora sp. NPDC057223 TaxID=3346055 RepID=UPI00363ECB98